MAVFTTNSQSSEEMSLWDNKAEFLHEKGSLAASESSSKRSEAAREPRMIDQSFIECSRVVL